MDDEIRLGYQAALVSMESPCYGRLWLSIAHHPGDTVSFTQAEALVRAAEERTGLRPRRRAELFQERINRVDGDIQCQLHTLGDGVAWRAASGRGRERGRGQDGHQAAGEGGRSHFRLGGTTSLWCFVKVQRAKCVCGKGAQDTHQRANFVETEPQKSLEIFPSSNPFR